MKKLLLLTLAITLISLGSVALADDVAICIKKAGDNKATVSDFNTCKNSSTVSIKFADGTSWDDVRDSYTVSSDDAAALAAGKKCIKVESDGGISLHASMMPADKENSKKDDSKK